MAVTGSINLKGDLYKDIIKKIDAPSTIGTAGQVLGLDSNLKPVWMNQSGGAEIDDTAGAGDTDKTFSADKLVSDHNSLLNAITSLDNSKAPIIIDSASGAIATFPDGADGLPLESLVVGIEPVQSGTGDPSPSNVRPITGWTGCNVTRCGKNLLNIHGTVYDTKKNLADPIALANYSVIQGWAYNGYVRPNNVTMTISEDSITMTVPDGTYGVGLIAKVKAGQKYTFSATHNGYVVCGFYTENGTYVSHTAIGTAQSYTVTIPSGAEYAILLVRGIAAGTVTYSNIQFESGEIASTYEPFKASETYPITWEEAGTVYGGTVNPVTGKLIVDRAIVDMGTLNWSYDSQYQRFFTVGLTSVIKKGSSGWILPICSAYKSAVGVSDDKTISEYATTGYVYIKDTSYTDAAVFKTALSGVKLVYELAATVEYDLTPTEIRTLLGTNNIWADTGDVAVDYRADTKLYVERMSASGGITVDTALSSSSTNPVQNKVINTALAAKEPKHNTVSVSGTTPTISGVADTRYICGECSTLTIVAPASGCIDVTFESGSTATVLTVTPPTGMTMKWANGFDPTALEANTTYEINIMDGCLGVAGSWT